jgi:type I restriction enzyme, S subunit
MLIETRDALLPRLISGKLSVDALDIRFPPGMTTGLESNS